MASSISFRPARRSEAKPLIGIYAESGCGKTFGSLLLARGFVGPKGRICLADSEAGRGEAYGDPTEYPEIGGYDVCPIRDDFSPQTYGEVITAAEREGYDALIVDSGSHEWEGVGGVLDMAAQNQAQGKKGVLVWQQPKLLHQRHFMGRLLQTSIPLVILSMRAKFPMEQRRNQQGQMDWVRSDRLEPKQADDILHEMAAHGYIDQQHKFHLTKITSRDMEVGKVFPEGEPITVDTGRRLRAWAEQREITVTGTKQAPPPAAVPADDAPFVIMKQNGESGCATIEDWRDRMLAGISRLAPHQAEALYTRNDPLMRRYKIDHPEEVGEVEEAFADKLGG